MFEQRVRQLQLIVFALIQGALVFAAIAAWMVSQGRQQQPQPNLDVLRIVAWVVFVVMVIASNYVPPLLARQQIRQIANGTWKPSSVRGVSVEWLATDEGKLLQVFFSQTIIRVALIEAPAMLGCVAALVLAQYETLIIAGLCVGLMILAVPLAPRVRAWLDQQQAQLEELRARSL